ncbi:MAG: hypothetical protein RJB62_1030, partial [Pseudomonadota bacterium]
MSQSSAGSGITPATGEAGRTGDNRTDMDKGLVYGERARLPSLFARDALLFKVERILRHKAVAMNEEIAREENEILLLRSVNGERQMNVKRHENPRRNLR